MLKDSDKMPFGKHKDTKMEEVPAQHLMALHVGELLDLKNPDHKNVHDYIVENLQVLEKEIKEESNEIYRSMKKN
jgi:acetyl-CoA acetyltransferase